MLAIVSITAPIFLLILLGYGSVRAGWVPREAALGMGRYVVSFALPALVFNVLSKRPLDEILVAPFLIAYTLGSLLAFAVGVTLAAALRRTSVLDNGFFGMGVSMSNSGYIGYALVTQTLGPQATVSIAMTMMVEILIVMPLTLVFAELSVGQRSRGLLGSLGDVARMVAKNPIMQAIALGLLCSGLGWQLPAALSRAVDMLAGSSAAVALFAIGGTLAGQRLRHGLGSALAIAAGKLLVHPLAVLSMLALVPAFDPTLAQAAPILAGVPMVTIFPLLAQRYGQGEQCASALLVTTLLSFATLNLGLWAFDIGPR